MPGYRQGDEILRNALDAVIAINSDGEIILWNPRAEETFGWTAQAVLGNSMAELLIPVRLRDAHLAGLTRLLSQADTSVLNRRMEIEALRKDGHEIIVELSISAMPGDPPTVAAFARDVTEHRALESERTLLAAMVESSPQSMMTTDLEGTIIGWNNGAEVITGYSRAEAMGRHIAFLTPSNVGDVAAEMFAELIGGKSVIDWETKSKRRDCSTFDVSISVFPVRDDSGDIIGIASAGTDITERKRAAAELTASRARFHEMVAVLVRDRRIIEANETFYELTGSTPETIIGQPGIEWLFT